MRAVKMGMRLVLVAAAIISVTGIKVPVDKTVVNSTQINTAEESESSDKPVYYEQEEQDSYLVPPNAHLEDLSDEIATLATYLLPPSDDKPVDYYKPTEAGEQTDWYPITPAVSPLPRQLLPPREAENSVPIIAHEPGPIFGTFRPSKLVDKGRYAPVPSRDLQPPLENATSEYDSGISDEVLGIPFEIEKPVPQRGYPLKIWNGPIVIPNNVRANPLSQIPYTLKKYRNPTKLYPKKYAGAFKPVLIPVSQTNDEIEEQKPKPIKQYKTNQVTNNESPSEDKTILKFEEAQKKRKLKRKPENLKVEESDTSESNEDVPSLEQDTSATNYRRPLRQPYPASLRQAPKPATSKHAQTHGAPADGDRTEFRMHGMKGPHSYQFGFDTGKGKNRQFRYEERDNNGHVKGHYGYMDKSGKLRVVNYDADPQHGFRAEAPVDAEQ